MQKRMKKSKFIELCIVASVISVTSCRDKKSTERKVFMRTDSTANYSHAGAHAGMFYAFRPFGLYNQYTGYSRAGYYSSAINEKSNVGSNSYKRSVVRGGFGRSSFHVSA